jgi:hypothetical protein
MRHRHALTLSNHQTTYFRTSKSLCGDDREKERIETTSPSNRSMASAKVLIIGGSGAQGIPIVKGQSPRPHICLRFSNTRRALPTQRVFRSQGSYSGSELEELSTTLSFQWREALSRCSRQRGRSSKGSSGRRSRLLQYQQFHLGD